MKYILENENDLEIFEDAETKEDMSGFQDYPCNLCENVFEAEIRLVAHEWQDHRGKSTLIVVPRNPPPWFYLYCNSLLENGKPLCRE
jgi:hypothetical protein